MGHLAAQADAQYCQGPLQQTQAAETDKNQPREMHMHDASPDKRDMTKPRPHIVQLHHTRCLP